MGTLSDSKSPSALPPVFRHVPAVPVLSAFSMGIVADWYLNWTALWWLAFAISSAVCWVVLFRRDLARWSAAVLLLGCALSGAAAHHVHWSLVSPHELMAFARDEPQPVRLRAVIESPSAIIPVERTEFPTALPQRDRSVATLRALALIADGSRETTIRVAGRVRLDVHGVLPQLDRGTEVEIWGHLVRPSVARNPGGFDFRMFLRERGMHTLVRVEFPECVQVRSPPPARWLPDPSAWQSIIADRLRKRLSPQNAPLAIALLLGPRTDVSQELKQAFLHSGTVHFLAISGINVAILVAFLWPLVRLTRLPRWVCLLIMGLCVSGYVAITDADPPVIRAAVLVCMLLLSLVSGRVSSPLNQLAIAALIILIWNPHDLFQVGAQLSFLAILALHWLISLRPILAGLPADPLDELDPSWWLKTLRLVRKTVWEAFLATCAVWLFTLPLVLSRFHLVSPVGFVVNVFMSLWVTVTLAVGYLCLLLAIVCPPLLTAPAMVFDWALSGFAGIIRFAADVPGGHFKLLGPLDPWLAAFYLLLISAGSGLLTLRWRRWSWYLILVWCVSGLAWAAIPPSKPGLRCTFLSVGHGAAVLIELPNQQTILYDAGSLEDANRARQVVESALIARGKTRLDALLISHADIDHFNAVPGLLNNIPIGGVYVSPTFLDFRQPSVRLVCEATQTAGVPLKLVWSDDRLKNGTDVELQILQPPAKGLSTDDNANSIVLSIRYAGRGLLLTGDLEKAGLQSLLGHPPRPHDILLSPHHGSLKANPPDLARWVNPRWVVVSGGGDTAIAKLQANYGDGVTRLSTSRRGAVTVEITPQGDIDVTTQLAP